MDFSQLIYFERAAKLLSISKAAEEMHVSQPTVSIAIKKLEDELGSPLFDHSKKPLVLSSLGEAILPRVELIISEKHNISSHALDFSENSKTVIRLGLPLTLFNNFICPLIQNFSAENPNVILSLFQYGTEEITKKVILGDLDVGIACDPNDSSLSSTKLTTLEFYVYFSPESDLAKYERITPKALSRYELLLSNSNESTVEKTIVKYLNNTNYTFNIDTINGILMPTSTLILAELNKGIAILSKNEDITKLNLLKKPMNPPLLIPFSIIWNKKSYLSNSYKKLFRFLKQTAKETL